MWFACEIDWAEARWALQPIVTGAGIVISVWIAVTVPRRQKRHDQRAYALATLHVLGDGLKRVAERLEIRFDPAAYGRTGRRLRQNRANAAIKSLMDLKIEELPIELVPAFSEARGALSALNEAMNAEPVDPWPPAARDLVRYRTNYEIATGAVAALNEAAGKLKIGWTDLPDWSLPPPSKDEKESVRRTGEERPGS